MKLDPTRSNRDESLLLQHSCDVYAPGSFGGGYWKWAWANSSLLESIARKGRVMQKLALISGMDFFELEAFEADENMAWEVTGMALKEIGGIGIYHCPSKSSDFFVVIERVVSNRPRV